MNKNYLIISAGIILPTLLIGLMLSRTVTSSAPLILLLITLANAIYLLRLEIHKKKNPLNIDNIPTSSLTLDNIKRFAANYFSRDIQPDIALQQTIDILMTNLAAAITISDPTTEALLFCNPYIEALTGYTLEEIQELNAEFFQTLIIDDDFARFKRAFEVCSIGEDTSVRYRIRHQRGLILWVESHFVPISFAAGKIDAIMAVSNDVTASVRYQERVEEQNRDLNDFSYMVSHDLKAPIFSIKGMAKILQEELVNTNSESIAECLFHITEGSTRLEKLVESLTEYSALSMSSSEEIDVNLTPVINNVLADLKTQILVARAQINIDQELPSVRGAEIRLYQVFSNLISNALKFRVADRECIIDIKPYRSSSDSVTISVSDNGFGIPKDRLDSIFRPFQRAHSKEIEGNGIGLASVKKIVERFGGRIDVESVEGQGTTFFITLMRSREDTKGVPAELSRWY